MRMRQRDREGPIVDFSTVREIVYDSKGILGRCVFECVIERVRNTDRERERMFQLEGEKICFPLSLGKVCQQQQQRRRRRKRNLHLCWGPREEIFSLHSSIGHIFKQARAVRPSVRTIA